MAERLVARSSSRRNAPQSPPKAAPAHQTASSSAQEDKRITRSQSRDASDIDIPASRSQRLVRGVSAEPGRGRKSTNFRQVIHAKSPQGLSAVLEDPSGGTGDERGESVVGTYAQTDEQDTRVLESKSPGGLSVRSGTTVQTSHSVQELQDLDKDEMLAHLPELSNASDGLLNFLVPRIASERQYESMTNDLQDPGSLARKTIDRLTRNFLVQKDTYGDDAYIDTGIALRGLLDVSSLSEISDGPWRPDELFYKANLAILAKNIYSPGFMSSDTNPSLDKLERDFPSLFLAQIVKSKAKDANSPGESNLERETFEIALDLRTQYFIATASDHTHDPDFDPNIELGQLFYRDSTTLRGWDVKGFRDDDLSKQHRAMIIQRIEGIKWSFSDDSQVVSDGRLMDFQSLHNQHPRLSFLTRLLAWIRLRNEEVEAHVDTRNGIYGLQKALEKKVTERSALSEQRSGMDNSPFKLAVAAPSDASQLNSDQAKVGSREERHVQISGLTDNKEGRINYDSPSSIQHIKGRLRASRPNLERSLTSSSRVTMVDQIPSTAPLPGKIRGEPRTTKVVPRNVSPSAPLSLLGPIAPGSDADDAWRPTIEDDGVDVIPRPERNSINEPHQILQEYKLHILEEDKENRAQAGLSSAISSRKHTLFDRQAGAEKIHFDSQFSSQGPKPSALKRPRNDEGMSSPSEDEGFQNDHRVQISRGQPAISRSTRVLSAKRPRVTEEIPTNRSRSNNDAVIDNVNDEPPMTQLQTWKVANAGAKRERARQSQKKSQRRRPWTDNETAALIDLITKYGTSWSYLKKMDVSGCLKGRDQVALKDKARNLKVDYLTHGVELPENFDQIRLKASDKETLGIDSD